MFHRSSVLPHSLPTHLPLTSPLFLPLGRRIPRPIHPPTPTLHVRNNVAFVARCSCDTVGCGAGQALQHCVHVVRRGSKSRAKKVSNRLGSTAETHERYHILRRFFSLWSQVPDVRSKIVRPYSLAVATLPSGLAVAALPSVPRLSKSVSSDFCQASALVTSLGRNPSSLDALENQRPNVGHNQNPERQQQKREETIVKLYGPPRCVANSSIVGLASQPCWSA